MVRAFAVAALIASAAVGGCSSCNGGQPAQSGKLKSPVKNADGTWGVVYYLPTNVVSLYPDQSWLPAYYKPSYPDLATTIKTFTNQSIARANMTGVTAVASISPYGPIVALTGPALQPLEDFANMHAAFFDANHAMQALNGVNACKAAGGCWDPHPGAQPWSFFLPLGMPMTNQQAVLFLNYPPDDSLTDVDYLKNFTMERWYKVLATVGIANPYLYETIVDAHPIAAPGTLPANDPMPDATTYFNSPGNSYINPMLVLLTNPPSNGNATSVPIMVLGDPAQVAWSKIINAPVTNYDVGQTTLPGASKPTSWVASRHPDDTTYQCCPGDPYAKCCVAPYPCWQLVPFEIGDLVSSCVVQTFATSPSTTPAAAKAACTTQWNAPANAHTVCVRARQDYDYKSTGYCSCPEAAEKFCNQYANDACSGGTFQPCDNSVCSTKSATPKKKRAERP